MGYSEGDKVTYKGMEMPAEIISGPHKTHGADRWLIRKADDTVTLARESELSAIKDRRTLVAEALFRELSGYGSSQPFSVMGAAGQRMYFNAADTVLAALDSAPEPAKRPLKAGDRIRILRSNLDGADVRKGDVLKVTGVDDTNLFRGEAPIWKHPRGYWLFSKSAEGTGWERVSDARG